MTPPIKRLVIDILKPHEPDITEFATKVAARTGVEAANATLLETDRKVQNVKITMEGDGIDQDEVEEAINRLGGTVHSVDQVVCGERLVEQSATPQD